MVKIRLRRAGARNRPFYHVVVIDERRQRDGRALEFLGTYDPKTDPVQVHLDLARLDEWVARGARVSQGVRPLVRRARSAAPAGEAASA